MGRRVGDFRDGVLRIYRSVSERGRWIGKTSSILLFITSGSLIVAFGAVDSIHAPVVAGCGGRTLPGIEPFHIALWLDTRVRPACVSAPPRNRGVDLGCLVALYLNGRERAWVMIGVLLVGGTQG